MTTSGTFAVIPDEGRVEIRSEVIADAPPPGHVVVAAEASVISAGTELSVFSGTSASVRVAGAWDAYPFRPGYGAVGRVLRVGAGVSRVAEGERIFFFGKHASVQSYPLDRTFPRGMHSAFPIAEDVPAARAAMLRMALIALAGIQTIDVQPGDDIAVLGLGTIGNLTAQILQLQGARVFAVGSTAGRCRLAIAAGIERVLEVPAKQRARAVLDATEGRGVVASIDATGRADGVLQCIEATRPNGHVVLLGSPRAAEMGNLTATFGAIHSKSLHVHGAHEWRLPPYRGVSSDPSVEENFARLAALTREGRLNLDVLVTDVIAPGNLADAYEGLRDRPDTHLGVVIDWREAGRA